MGKMHSKVHLMSVENTSFKLDDQRHSASKAKPLRGQIPAKLTALALQKIWLPHAIYLLIPIFYIFAGVMMLLAALYLPSSGWFLPYAIAMAGIVFHAAITIGIARYRGYRKMATMPSMK